MEDHTGIRRTRSATSELVYRIRARIREQELLPGEKLGSERALADSLGVSRSDLRNALTVLESDHEIIRNITRLRYIENRPLSLERSHLPAYLFPLFLTRDLTTPFYTMFERDYGVYPCNVDETLESVVGDEQENELLQIEAGTPLMRIHRIAYASDGCPFERATDVYIADRMRFTMHHSGYVRLSATSTQNMMK